MSSFTTSCLPVAIRTVSDAVKLDDNGSTKEAYCAYLGSILFIIKSLKDDAWDQDFAKICNNDTIKLLKLAGQCHERATDIICSFQKREIQRSSSEMHTRSTQQSPYKGSGSWPVSSASFLNQQQARSQSVVSNTQRRISPQSLSNSDNFQKLMMSLPTPPKSRKTSSGSVKSVDQLQNQQILQAYQRRKSLQANVQKKFLADYNLGLLRRSVEDMVIEKARRRALNQKLQERRARLQEKAEQRFAHQTGSRVTDAAYQKKMYTKILEFEQETSWPQNYREELIREPENTELIETIVCSILRSKEHPIGQIMAEMQYALYKECSIFVADFVCPIYDHPLYGKDSKGQVNESQSDANEPVAFGDSNAFKSDDTRGDTSADCGIDKEGVWNLDEPSPDIHDQIEPGQKVTVDQEDAKNYDISTCTDRSDRGKCDEDSLKVNTNNALNFAKTNGPGNEYSSRLANISAESIRTSSRAFDNAFSDFEVFMLENLDSAEFDYPLSADEYVNSDNGSESLDDILDFADSTDSKELGQAHVEGTGKRKHNAVCSSPVEEEEPRPEMVRGDVSEASDGQDNHAASKMDEFNDGNHVIFSEKSSETNPNISIPNGENMKEGGETDNVGETKEDMEDLTQDITSMSKDTDASKDTGASKDTVASKDTDASKDTESASFGSTDNKTKTKEDSADEDELIGKKRAKKDANDISQDVIDSANVNDDFNMDMDQECVDREAQSEEISVISESDSVIADSVINDSMITDSSSDLVTNNLDSICDASNHEIEKGSTQKTEKIQDVTESESITITTDDGSETEAEKCVEPEAGGYDTDSCSEIRDLSNSSKPSENPDNDTACKLETNSNDVTHQNPSDETGSPCRSSTPDTSKDIIKQNGDEDDFFNLSDNDPDLKRTFEKVVKEIHSSLNKLHSLLIVTYDELDMPIGRDQSYASLETIFFEPLWPWLCLLFRRLNLVKEKRLYKVIRKRWECEPSSFFIRQQFSLSDPEENSQGYPYQLAVEELRKIISYTTPLDKLDCIVQTSKLVCQCVKDYWEKKSDSTPPSVGCDDLLPILTYVVVKAALPQLVSECHSMEEFIHENYLLGEEGYCLTTLSTAIAYVLNLGTGAMPGDAVNKNIT